MANDKVKFGLKNVHYAILSTTGYGTPVALPGAVSLTLSPEGDEYSFFADDIAYYKVYNNSGYSGSLEIALIDDDFRKNVLGEILDSADGTLMEVSSGAEAIKFALGFEVDGDVNGTKFWFYNCTCSRPELSAETKTDSVEVKTDTLNISNTPDANGNVKVKTTPTTSTAVLSGWYTTVYTG